MTVHRGTCVESYNAATRGLCPAVEDEHVLITSYRDDGPGAVGT